MPNEQDISKAHNTNELIPLMILLFIIVIYFLSRIDMITNLLDFINQSGNMKTITNSMVYLYGKRY